MAYHIETIPMLSADYQEMRYFWQTLNLGRRPSGTPAYRTTSQKALKNAFLGQLVTEWMGPLGELKRLGCQARGMDTPGSPITAKGNVTKKYQESGEHLVDCDIWLENTDAQKTTPGTATVALPSRRS